MPKNPWVYKSRKRRRKTKKSPTEEDLSPRLPTSSYIDGSMGTLSSETLTVPLNQLKKEIIYPDTRFQKSTTLFPAMIEENCEIPRKILKRDPDEIEKDSGLKAERSSKEWSNEVMLEISLPNDNLRKYEDITCPDSRLQRSSLFPARGIENIIPETHREISGRATEDEKSVMGQEVNYKMPDPSISIEAMSEIPLSKSNPSKYKDTVCSDVLFQPTNALFPSEEVKIIPSETLYVSDDFLTVSEKVDLNHFTNFDQCVVNDVSNPKDEVEETEVSHRAMSQLKVLEVRSIPSEELSDTSVVYDDLNTSSEDVKMIDLSNSDYCFGSGNSNSAETVPGMVNTRDFPNFNRCDASHIPNSQEEVEEIDLNDVPHQAMSQLKMLREEGIPAEELSETSRVYDVFETTSEEVKENDLPKSDHCVPNGFSDFQDEAEEVDISHRAISQLKMLEVGAVPAEEFSDSSLMYDEFETTSEEVEVNDLHNFNYCDAVRHSNFSDDIEEIDLTEDSQRVVNQLQTFDIDCIHSKRPTETLRVNDAVEMKIEKVKMNDSPNSDYCVIIGNSNSPNEVEEIDLTNGTCRVLSRLITLD